MNERVWIYTVSKPLSTEQISELKALCHDFVSGWTAHEMSLDASFELYKDRLLVFKVNQAKYHASGCSIDKQLRFVKELEQKFQVELLNRLLVAYEDAAGDIRVVHQSVIKTLLNEGKIDSRTLVFDNSITSSPEMAQRWKLPISDSWLSKYLQTPA